MVFILHFGQSQSFRFWGFLEVAHDEKTINDVSNIKNIFNLFFILIYL